MKKNIEWLKEEIWYSDRNIGLDWKEFVLNLIDQLDEAELPVIPKFVANFIESYDGDFYSLLYDADNISSDASLVTEEYYELGNWLSVNSDELLQAVANGYTVEEEPLYRARLKVITDEFIASYLRTQSSDAEDRLKALEIGSKYIHEDYRHLSEFTEDELKKLDIWDSEQWEVEELEE